MKVIIIGGGAAGMMAAYQAAKCGNDVSLYEKNEKCAKININAMNIFSTTYL